MTPIVDHRAKEVDALWGELEALTRTEEDESVRFQCPECGRFVDESASMCACGVRFEGPADIVGYECPVCRSRVTAEATRCSCGARFG